MPKVEVKAMNQATNQAHKEAEMMKINAVDHIDAPTEEDMLTETDVVVIDKIIMIIMANKMEAAKGIYLEEKEEAHLMETN